MNLTTIIANDKAGAEFFITFPIIYINCIYVYDCNNINIAKNEWIIKNNKKKIKDINDKNEYAFIDSDNDNNDNNDINK